MITVDLNNIEMLDAWEATLEDGSDTHLKAAFPLSVGVGTKSTAVIYFELEPGHALPSHTDSPEELLYVVKGEVEAIVGEERARLSEGGLAVIPAMVPHHVVNVGDGVARCIGFFSSGVVASTFEAEMQPMNQRLIVTPPVTQS